MWKHVAAHAFRKTAPLRLKLYIARDKRTMIRLQSSLLFIYTATHLCVPAYSPLVFFVFCLVLFLTSFEEKKSAKRRFFLSLSLFWLSFLSLEVFLSHQEACLVSLSPAILMNLREVFRERHFAAQKRARAREKRERERKRRERERARKRTLFTDGSFSPLLFLSAITARN